MAKKTEIKTEKLEREYVIPLRREFEKVPRYRRANKAVSAIKKFLVRHMKIRDGDVNKIRLDRYLNEEIWHRGIRKPPVKIKVKAVKEGDIVRVEMAELPEKLKFKKAREEKRESKGAEVAKKKKENKEKTEEKTKEEIKEDTEQKKEDQKEKEGATEESMEAIEKQNAKQAKHESVPKVKQPKRPFRQALQK